MTGPETKVKTDEPLSLDTSSLREALALPPKDLENSTNSASIDLGVISVHGSRDNIVQNLESEDGIQIISTLSNTQQETNILGAIKPSKRGSSSVLDILDELITLIAHKIKRFVDRFTSWLEGQDSLIEQDQIELIRRAQEEHLKKKKREEKKKEEEEPVKIR